jgi:hypothetical protein
VAAPHERLYRVATYIASPADDENFHPTKSKIGSGIAQHF